jgi:hypothetical protein
VEQEGEHPAGLWYRGLVTIDRISVPSSKVKRSTSTTPSHARIQYAMTSKEVLVVHTEGLVGEPALRAMKN